MSSASYGATKRSKIPGEMTVDEASPPPCSMTSNLAPAMDFRYRTLRSKRILRNAWTHSGSSYVAMMRFSIPYRTEASCQQPDWPYTSKNGMNPLRIPFSPTSAA